MKKTTFLLALTIFYVGIGFTKTPEIINPPRPHAKFKWLLVVEHNLYPDHTHYLYTNKYHIFKESDGWIWILPEGRYEVFSADKGETPRPVDVIFHTIFLSYPEILRHAIFLRSKAPKPLTLSKNLGFNDKDIRYSWMKNAKKIKLKARKAKVIFTTEPKK